MVLETGEYMPKFILIGFQIIIIVLAVSSFVLINIINLGLIYIPGINSFLWLFFIIGTIAEISYRLLKIFDPNIFIRIGDKERKGISLYLDQSSELFKNIIGFDIPIRADIMVVKGIIYKKIRIEFISSYKKTQRDVSICLEKWQGCAGLAWGLNEKIFADLSLDESILNKKGYALWGLTPELRDKTKSIKAIFSTPIRHPDNVNKVVAILNYDSDVQIPDAFDPQNDLGKKISKHLDQQSVFFGDILKMLKMI